MYDEDMYSWFVKNLQEYYQFVRVLKKDDKKDILLYKHKVNGRYIVFRSIKGDYPVYQRLREIRNKNVAEVLETVCNENETLVLEEYVDGISIADMLETNRYHENDMCKIVVQICEGLYSLHSNRVIHRDIKPENVLVQGDGIAKLIDFDSAKIYKDYVQKDTVILGTVGYAAPEQYGEAQSDEKSDIYGLGILMNVMLTGKHPVKKVVHGKVGKIIEKCIMVNPNKRYENVLEIRKKLKKLIY